MLFFFLATFVAYCSAQSTCTCTPMVQFRDDELWVRIELDTNRGTLNCTSVCETVCGVASQSSLPCAGAPWTQGHVLRRMERSCDDRFKIHEGETILTFQIMVDVAHTPTAAINFLRQLLTRTSEAIPPSTAQACSEHSYWSSYLFLWIPLLTVGGSLIVYICICTCEKDGCKRLWNFCKTLPQYRCKCKCVKAPTASQLNVPTNV